MIMRRLSVVTLMVIAVTMLSTAVHGGTPCAHFTGNRHDTLLIGEIIASSDEVLIIRSTGFIVSAGTRIQDGHGRYMPSDREIARNLRREAARQLRPEVAVVSINHPGEWWPAWASNLSVGEYVIASLNRYQEGDRQIADRFVVAWGIYRVDSLDYRTLKVDAMCFAGTYDYFTRFVNSRGYGGYFIPAGEEPPWPFRNLTYGLMGMGVVVVILAVFTQKYLGWAKQPPSNF